MHVTKIGNIPLGHSNLKVINDALFSFFSIFSIIWILKHKEIKKVEIYFQKNSELLIIFSERKKVTTIL